jgi:hypothetical protein
MKYLARLLVAPFIGTITSICGGLFGVFFGVFMLLPLLLIYVAFNIDGGSYREVIFIWSTRIGLVVGFLIGFLVHLIGGWEGTKEMFKTPTYNDIKTL